MSRSSCLLIAVALVPLAACTEVLETSEVEQRIDVPDVKPWKRGQGDPAALFPKDTEHLTTATTPASDDATYNWGIASGEVLWIYRVDDRDADDFMLTLTLAWQDREVPGAKVSHSIVGIFKGVPPPPPPPIGEPEFSPTYIRIVVGTAQHAEDATVQMVDDLEAAF